MWERGWSFIKKAGTIILLSTIIVWFTTYFGFVDGQFQMLSEDQISNSILAAIGNCIAWIFTPLGWGNWQAAVASVTVLSLKRISLVQWVFFIRADGQKSAVLSQQSAVSHSSYSTSFVLLASQLSVL